LASGFDHEFRDLDIGDYAGQITVISLVGATIIPEKCQKEVAEALLVFWKQAPDNISFEEPIALAMIRALKSLGQLSLLPEVPVDESERDGDPLVYLARLAQEI